MEQNNKPDEFRKQHEKAEHLIADLMPRKFGKTGKLWVVFLLVVILVGLIAYIQQLKNGLIVTDMRDFTSWGIYISNFVFFVAISLVGSLVSAILKLSNVHWRVPLVRISEIIAVASIIFAALIIVVDMGRPDRIFNLLIHGRIQSPIIWDVIVIATYFVLSILLLYIPLIPDLAMCRDNLTHIAGWRKKLYRILSLNWRGTEAQYSIINKCIRILIILIIPLALSIHTVTSWLFATTYRAGWDSTNFGPYFVSGAFMVGAASVIALMYVIRNHYNLKKYITNFHFDRMGRLLLLLSLVYLYFNINEYLVSGFKMKKTEGEQLLDLFSGNFAPMFWLVQIFGMILPILFLIFKPGRKPVPVFIISIFVVVGAWFKRFLIVTPTLLHPFIPIQHVPASWMHYNPTWQEWAITSATLAGALLIITLFVRLFPIIPIWEISEEKGMKHELFKSEIKK